MTNIQEKIICGRSEFRKRRDVVEFLEVKNGLARFLSKLRMLRKKVIYGNIIGKANIDNFCI